MTRARLRPLLSGVVLRSQSDARLAQLAGEGHQLAFTTIFERYHRELTAHAAGVVRAGRADDVVQGAMLNAWSAMLSGEVVAEPRAWLHRVVHNVALNTVARRGYDDNEIPETTASPRLTDEIAHGRMSATEALAAVAALPAAQRRALTLTALEGRSGADAATEMGISETAMRQLVYRARNGVRSAVSAVTPAPVIVSALHSIGTGGAATIAGASAAGAFGGVAVKTAIVIAVAAGGVGATAVVSHDNYRHPRARHAQTTSTIAGTPVAVASIASELPATQATDHVTRSGRHGGAGGRQGGQGRHRASAGHSEHDGDANPNTTGGTSRGAAYGSTGRQGSSGERSGASGPDSSNSSDDATRDGSRGPSTDSASAPPRPVGDAGRPIDDAPSGRSSTRALAEPSETHASTSHDDDRTSSALTNP